MIVYDIIDYDLAVAINLFMAAARKLWLKGF
jgi:hypothetical protein